MAIYDAPFPAYCPELTYHHTGNQEILSTQKGVFVCSVCNCRFTFDNTIIKHGDFYGERLLLDKV